MCEIIWSNMVESFLSPRERKRMYNCVAVGTMDLTLAVAILFLLAVGVLIACRSPEDFTSAGFGTLSGLHWYNQGRQRCDERGCYIQGPIIF